MREILFRGKTKSGYWVYGSLIKTSDYCCILESEENVHPMDYPYLDGDLGVIDGKATPIIPETIGQWTGLVDKNGNKIFEGDAVKTEFGRLCMVRWFSSRSFMGWDLEVIRTHDNLAYTDPPVSNHLWLSECLEVINNIHDNPELLERK